jgi:hypothetical protein
LLSRERNFCYASLVLRTDFPNPMGDFMLRSKLRSILRASCLIAVVLAASLLAAQTEFSAEIVDLQKPGTPTTGKLYFAKSKMRIESLSSGPRAGGVVIVNFATQMSTVLMTQRNMYMERSIQSQGQSQMYSFFQAGDVQNACGDLEKIEHAEAGSCHKIGSETVNGRSTVEYEGTRSGGEVSRFWLDPKLRFPVKWQGKNSGGELRNIQEASQPTSLFEVPAGYTKMDIGAMMQQHQPQ